MVGIIIASVIQIDNKCNSAVVNILLDASAFQ